MHQHASAGTRTRVATLGGSHPTPGLLTPHQCPHSHDTCLFDPHALHIFAHLDTSISLSKHRISPHPTSCTITSSLRLTPLYTTHPHYTTHTHSNSDPPCVTRLDYRYTLTVRNHSAYIPLPHIQVCNPIQIYLLAHTCGRAYMHVVNNQKLHCSMS